MHKQLSPQEELSFRLAERYDKLTSEFIKQIEGLDLAGMPQPHIPVVGSEYHHAKYKLAFIGFETAGWGNLKDFVENFKNKGKAEYREDQDGSKSLDNLDCLNWRNNFHTSFWDFIFQFLANFYKVDVKDVREGRHPELIKSIIWGNTHAIERYEVSAISQDVLQETHSKIEEASRIFNNGMNMIEIAKPNVVIILNQTEKIYNPDWITSDKTDEGYLKLDNVLEYRYIRSTRTHIFWTHHPRSLYANKLAQQYIDKIIECIREYHVWESLPENTDSIFNQNPQTDMNQRRDGFIAKIAKTLVETQSVMTGEELAMLLKTNGIKDSKGNFYEIGTRGVFNGIRAAWTHYHDSGDEQTAFNILRAFVNKNNDFAW